MPRLVVFASDHEASRFWAAKWLRDYGIGFLEEDARLTVEATALHEEAHALVERLVQSYEDVRAEAERQGIEIKPYKPLESHVIFVAMVAALRGTRPGSEERHAAILHECVWAQGLPNANHRSTMFFVIDLMRESAPGRVDPEVVREAGERFAEASKREIREKEWTAAPAELKARHAAAAHAFVREIAAAFNRGP